jgi:N-acetylmuramoyl-L-alanine amidase
LEDKDDTLAAVLLDLSQSATLEASGAVAEHVLRALAKIGPTHRGYVEKANFVVLRSPDVPSILVETAFITNPNEERRLTNPAQQERLAGAILDGVREYFRATPPPGSWFAANVRKDKPVAAARASVEASLDERSAARAPSS